MFVCVLCRYFYCIQNKGGFIDSFCLKLKKTCKLQNYIKFLSFLISSVAWIFWLLTYFLVFSDFYHRQHFGKSLVFFTESAIPRSRSLEQKHKRWWIKRRKKKFCPLKFHRGTHRLAAMDHFIQTNKKTSIIWTKFQSSILPRK